MFHKCFLKHIILEIRVFVKDFIFLSKFSIFISNFINEIITIIYVKIIIIQNYTFTTLYFIVDKFLFLF